MIIWVLLLITYNGEISVRVFDTEKQCKYESVQIQKPNTRDYTCVPIMMEHARGRATPNLSP